MRYLVLVLLLLPAYADEAKLYLQSGHSGEVTCAAYSHDGRFVVTGSEDQSALLWDAATGAEIRRFGGHTGRVFAIDISPDSHYLLTGGEDKTARIWDASTGAEVHRLFGHTDRIHAVAFSRDGRLAITGSVDKTAVLWDVVSGAKLRTFTGHSGSINAVAFSPDGRLILTGSSDGTARLWDLSNGREIRRFVGNTDDVEGVAFSPDGRRIVTASDDKTARIWDFASGVEIRRLTGHADDLNSAVFSPDGRSVLTTSQDNTARLWDAATGAPLRIFGREGDSLVSAVFSPDGRSVLAGGGGNNTAGLWNAATGTELRRFGGFSDAVGSVAIANDDGLIVTGSGETDTGYVSLWSTAAGSGMRRLSGLDGSIDSLSVSSDGRFLATGGLVHSAQLWELATGRELRKISVAAAMDAVTLSADGRSLLTLSSNEAAPRLWDAATGAQIRQFSTIGPQPAGWKGHSHFMAISPNGRLALTAGSTGGGLWNMASGALLRSFRSTAVAFSPDGRFVLSGNPNTAQLLDASTGDVVRQFNGNFGYIWSVAFSADGRYILTVSEDRVIRLWDASNGAELRRLSGHLDRVMQADFSHNGQFIVSVSEDGTTRIWRTGTGALAATLASFRKGGWAVVDPEGRYDASDPDNSPGLHFLAGNDVIELSQLKARFYSPNLLARIWRGDQLPPIAGSLKDIGPVPDLQVTAPAVGSAQAAIHLKNRGGGIGRVIVKVNGRELPGTTRGPRIDPQSPSADLRVDLSAATLSLTGDNVIEVFADNGEGVVRSRGVQVTWHSAPAAQANAPNLYAIVVGISTFDLPALNLRFAAKDARDFAHALELAGDGLFTAPRTHIQLLASGSALEPTRDNIRRAFDDVSRAATSNDLLVVYFAGHGAAARAEHDEYYYLTREARDIDPERDPALRAVSTISSTELKEWLGRKNMPLKQVIVLDTCAAGAAFGGTIQATGRRELSPDQVRAMSLLKDSTGSWILMGSAADSVSYETSRYAQGLVTYALLEGMHGAALDGDQVEVSRLFAFAQTRVEDLARGIGGIQRPVLSAPKGQTFPIGLLRPEDRARIAIASVKPELLQVKVFDSDDLDSLQLEQPLRAALRAASLPATRGGATGEPRIVYLDSVTGEVPGALSPQVRYSVSGGKVHFRLRLIRDGRPVAERMLDLDAAGPGSLSGAIVNAIVDQTTQLK